MRQGRREFLRAVTAGAAGTLLPLDGGGARSLANSHIHTFPHSQRFQDDWAAVRRQFLMPADRIYLNVGTLGVQPRPVVDAVVAATLKTAESFPPGVKWAELNTAVAALLDCDADGLVYPRNTTEAMNFVANGLEWRAGDHIVTTNHEHIGGLCCWQLVAARHGAQLTQVDLGPAPSDPQAVFDALTAAVTERTKLMSVSHVNFTTGFVMPVRELSRWCRERGIIFVVDGAHPPGMMRVSIREIDPDFYASSPHKWLLAPQGTGLLYMRRAWRTKLWPTLASGDWDKLELGAQRFNHLGSLDESRLAGLQAALAFHVALGSERVYERIAFLRNALIERLGALSRVQIVSPGSSVGAGMVSFKLDGLDSLELQKKLGEKNVRTRVIGEYSYGYMRLSPHVYTSVDEIDLVASLIRAAV